MEAAPKSKSWTARNTTCSYTYNRDTRLWDWRVTINVKPVVVEGHAGSELEAMREIQKHVKLGA